ncbi:MAG TPA: UDP-N-acetylmuramate dehydrogenase [Gallicola sp.]|nr:UDP-N-acetylmuramate dehydrogenase [Gallicola sp.]
MRIETDFDLTNYNSYRIKAKCKKAYFPENEEDIISLYKDVNSFIVLGSGHNVILSKEYYEDRFMILNGNFENHLVDEKSYIIQADAGITMLQLSEIALESGLGGLEIFYDIPSSLGGAVVMNAGASGEEIKDLIIKVRYLDLADMKIKEIENKDIGFEYRNSFFQKHKDKVILKAWLQLYVKDKSLIKEKMETIKAQRWDKQPKEYPNAGSVFKRPKGHFVGPMIDELNLKGYTVGGAQVSKKHGGFIVNFDNATGQDVIRVIDHVKSKVFAKFGVELEVEQRII